MSQEELEKELAPAVRQLAHVLRRLNQEGDIGTLAYLDTAMFAIQRCLDPGGALMSELRETGEARY